jgi:hypothetical protein
LEEFLTNNVTNHAVVIEQKLAVAYGEMLFTVFRKKYYYH